MILRPDKSLRAITPWRDVSARPSDFSTFSRLKILIIILALVCASRCVTAAESTNSEPVTERIAELKNEIGRLETRCVPTAGTTRVDVEQKFGPGTPGLLSKIPAEAPTNSLYRVYEFCTDGRLWVHYNKTWNVEWAHYEDPYQSKGLPAGVSIEPKQEVHELEQRLQQMTQIAREYKKRFGERLHP